MRGKEQETVNGSLRIGPRLQDRLRDLKPLRAPPSLRHSRRSRSRVHVTSCDGRYIIPYIFNDMANQHYCHVSEMCLLPVEQVSGVAKPVSDNISARGRTKSSMCRFSCLSFLCTFIVKACKSRWRVLHVRLRPYPIHHDQHLVTEVNRHTGLCLLEFARLDAGG